MSVLSWFSHLAREGRDVPEVTCYEKQGDWGGLWNYSWRTGTDQYGEMVHGSMYRSVPPLTLLTMTDGLYRYLWSNGPKECLEFPQYTFEDHFGKAIPSFPPREVLFDYLQGRWGKEDVRKWIKFRTVVRDVVFNEDTDTFSVCVKDLQGDRVEEPREFDYVIVCTGHFSVPHVPDFAGVERFPGRVMHAHDFRDANEFAGKTLLLIGSSYSAEDIALQCIKYGASKVIITWRSQPMGFNWPPEVEERPLIQRFEGKTAHFKDGSKADVDVVLMCTGYLHSYPFLRSHSDTGLVLGTNHCCRESLRLKSSNVLYPPGLYKGIVWEEGGNSRLLYCGAQDQYYTYTMFDVCGLWAVKLILGDIKLPSKEDREASWRGWVARNKALADCHQEIDFQTDFVMDLVKDCGADYPYNPDVGEMFHTWEGHKHDDILSYRDQSFPSKYTGNMFHFLLSADHGLAGTPSPVHHSTFMTALDDSLQTFMNKIKN